MDTFFPLLISILIFGSWVILSLYAANFWFTVAKKELITADVHKSKIFFWWYGFYFIVAIIGFIAVGFAGVFVLLISKGLGY